MRRVATLPLLMLGLLGAAGPIRCGDDPTPRLEAEKRELLASTVPKAQFWDAVGKKGELLKQEKEVEAQGAPLDEKKAALEAEIAAAESEVASARSARASAQTALDEARAELARAKGEQETREARLRTFSERHAAGDAS
jgi:chromosome segregation ATPase